MSQPAFDFGDEPLDDAANPTYTVGELAAAINEQLRRSFVDGVWVRGEIDGLRHSGPHTYFALVEDGDEGRAVLNVSLFAPMKRNLTPLLKKNRLELANGMKVRIFGHLDYYAPNGRLGLKMAGIDPRFTLGEMSQARDQVVRKLVAGGLYDANRSRPFPLVPLRVGVVTSVGTAAWHDFHDELERSGLGFRLRVCDTRVQGERAAVGIASAVRTLARRDDVDCVVVIRGGGARNELATFDAEAIAVAIANSPVPVVTGLGHEIDRSIADDVAHTAHKTPTACARALIDAVCDFRDQLDSTWAAIESNAGRRTADARKGLGDRAHRVARRTHAAVERADERLAMRRERLREAPRRSLAIGSAQIDQRNERLIRRAPLTLDSERRSLDDAAARLALLDPVNLLRRGWSITRDADGNVVRSLDEVGHDAVITTELTDGRLTSRVTGRTAGRMTPGAASPDDTSSAADAGDADTSSAAAASDVDAGDADTSSAADASDVDAGDADTSSAADASDADTSDADTSSAADTSDADAGDADTSDADTSSAADTSVADASVADASDAAGTIVANAGGADVSGADTAVTDIAADAEAADADVSGAETADTHAADTSDANPTDAETAGADTDDAGTSDVASTSHTNAPDTRNPEES